MQFALNYSPQAMALVREKVIDIDLFKCSSDFPAHITDALTLKPVYVHFSLNAGKPHQQPFDPAPVEAMLKQTSTKLVSVHLGATNEDFPDIPLESANEDHRKRVLEQLLKDVRVVTKHFGSEQVILENFPYHASARCRPGEKSLEVLRATVHPESIATVVKETGCGLLLDIDHALVTAHYMGQDVKEYIAQLPVQSIRELHMTGTCDHEGWLESHLPMQNDDWALFDWALGNIASGTWGHPEIFAFEYGGTGPAFAWRSDAKVIAEQVPKFRRRISQFALAS